MSAIGVVLDACVLIPGSLRDILFRAAEAELYRLTLTEDILEEVRRNLVNKNRMMTEEQGQHLLNEIRKHFKTNFVTRHTIIAHSMPINEKDRHVLAAAVASNSEIIVTQNLKDFPPHLLEPLQVEALSADDFLVHQFSLYDEIMIDIIQQHMNESKNPHLTTQQALENLTIHTPKFAHLLKRELYK